MDNVGDTSILTGFISCVKTPGLAAKLTLVASHRYIYGCIPSILFFCGCIKLIFLWLHHIHIFIVVKMCGHSLVQELVFVRALFSEFARPAWYLQSELTER